MKTIKLIVILFFLNCFSSVLIGEEIRITIGEWSPFISEKLPHHGIVPHMISEIFKASEIKVKYGFFPWARSSEYVKAGTWHASAIWGKTDEREKYFSFSDVVYTGESVLFYHKDQPIVWTGNGDDLRGLVIGLIRGAAKSNILKEAEQKGVITYDIAGSEIETFHKLLKKRFHAIDKNKAVGLYTIQTKLSPAQQAKIGYTKPHELWNYHLMFSKKLKENRKFLRIFNKGFQKIKASGKYEKMWKAFYSGEYNP